MEQMCVFNTYRKYISTNECGSVLDAQGAMPNAPTILSNVGAILIFKEESLLLNESRQFSLERQSQGKNSKMQTFVLISKDMSI
jgi:hypothetical protein